MGLRFRRSIGLGKGIRLNLGKGSLGVSAGTKGARVSVNSRRGVTTSVGAPGTGLSYSNTTGWDGQSGGIKPPSKRLMTIAAWVAVISICALVSCGLYLLLSGGSADTPAGSSAPVVAASASGGSSSPAPEDPGLTLRRAVRAYVSETYGEDAVSKVTTQTATVDVDVLVPYSTQTPPADPSAVVDQAKAVAAGIPGVFPAGAAQTQAIISLVDSEDNNLVVVGSDGKVYFDAFSGAGAASAPSSSPAEKMVYVSASGSKYHSKPDCGNMSSAKEITLSDALSRGLTACSRCW